MRLIDADALLEELNNLEPRCANKFVKQGIDDGLHYYMPKILEKQPTIDAVPVVRCKDCVHFVYDEFDGSSWCCRDREVETPELHFCSYGEWKDGDSE